MSDPRRLADEGGDATELERDLIRAERSLGLTRRDKNQIWMGISAHCVPPPLDIPSSISGAGSGSGAAAAGASGGMGVSTLAAIKGTILVVALGGGSFAGYRAWQHSDSPPLPAQTARVDLSPEVTEPQAPVAVRTRPRAVVARSTRPMPSIIETAAAKKARASRLAEESRMVLDARAALRDGDSHVALRLLESARNKFPEGELGQEREALTIEALARAGQRGAAARRAQAFLRAYPESPHAASVKIFTAP